MRMPLNGGQTAIAAYVASRVKAELTEADTAQLEAILPLVDGTRGGNLGGWDDPSLAATITELLAP